MEFRGANPKYGLWRGGLGLAAFFAFALIGMGCSGHGLGGSGFCGTEVADPDEVVGCVEDENGDPGNGVRVVAISSAGNAGLGKIASGGYGLNQYTVFTNSHGRYRFDSLPVGKYTFLFEDTATEQTMDWRTVVSEFSKSNDSGRYMPPTVRMARRSLFSGRVIDGATGKPIAGAVLSVTGLPFKIESGESGEFFLYLPGRIAGFYEVNCHKAPYTDDDQKVELNPNAIKYATITLTEGNPESEIPVPVNLKVSQDPATTIVTFSWTKPASVATFKYRAKRNEVENPAVSESWDVGTDTVQFDPVFAGETDNTITDKALYYSVACVRSNGTTGEFASIRFTAHRGPSVKLRLLDTAKTVFTVGDTARIVGTFASSFMNVESLAWNLRGSTDTLRKIEISGRSGSDTLSIPCTAPGDPSIEFRAKDETGLIAMSRIMLQIVSAPTAPPAPPSP
jgi:hypothetical protein